MKRVTSSMSGAAAPEPSRTAPGTPTGTELAGKTGRQTKRWMAIF